LLNGSKFDSSVDRGEPFEFQLGMGQVIKGWDEGVAMMNVGSKGLLVIPFELAYGSRDMGERIPAYSTLVFEVELLGVE
jgi:peptidylprolyl isomerase